MNNTNLHILLVDDDEDDRMFFEEALEDLNLKSRFEHVENGLEAIELLKDKDKLPDIVFLDLNMPILSGRECLQRIRANDDLKNLKVVIYSTSFDPVTVEQLYQNGANRYIRKPGAFKELKQTISDAILSLEREDKKPIPKKYFVINP
ncbi:response regulator [Pricia sp.]|uniref:response regulator n=1 Tax=Pricia sp. TaxID=2268138 RepID=UPI003593F7D6